MKVCLAALIPLLACLLVLPSDVSGRRRIRQELEEKEDEYEISHITKREMKFTEHFKAANIEETCGVCKQLYDIDKDDCTKAKKRAKLNCFRKARVDKSNFMAKFGDSGSEPAAKASEPAAAAAAEAPKESSGGSSGGNADWIGPDDPRRKLKLGSVDEYFKPENIKRTCTACKNAGGGINYDNCVADTENARTYCKGTMEEMRMKFITAWDQAPANRKKIVK